MKKCLKIRHLKKNYKKKLVVKDVSFEVNQEEIIALLGPNGAGKTTSFYMVVGIEDIDSGSIYLDDINITSYSMYQRARLGISYLAQEASIFKKLTVENNILAILQIHEKDKKIQKNRLEELLEKFDITHIRNSYGYQLSGGERRRTEIARSLASNPYFLLLDEPFAGVDPIAVGEIQEIILELGNQGLGILITDHNARETLKVTTRSYILAEGHVKYFGTPMELANNPNVRRIYLGDNFIL